MVSNSKKNYIFKVTVLSENDIILADLGGIRLRSHSTTDLGKKFDIESIKKSRSLAENIWNGDVWAWDTYGNQIGGWDLCNVEENLLESGTCESSDMAIVCLSGCNTDVISDYVALALDGDNKGLINVFQEKEISPNSPKGVWFAIPSYTESSENVDLLNPPVNYLKALSWGNLFDVYEGDAGVQEVNTAAPRIQIIYMLDRKTEKFYILQPKDVDLEGGKFCYIRKTLKTNLCGDCEKTTAVFGTNVPDACDTYLYNNFGVSSNISPYLVTGAQSLCGLTLSYQSSSLRDGRAVQSKEAQIFSPYRLWIEADGIRQFYIPLPGGDWQGRYLDFCNPSPLNVVEFFEGRSELWNRLNEFYQKWKEQKEGTYKDLVYNGCILGVYLDGNKGEDNFGVLPHLGIKFVVDSGISKDLYEAVKKETDKLSEDDKRKEEFQNLYSTGNPFYDEFLRFLYLIQSRGLFNADKISVYVDCNDEVRARQAAEIDSTEWNNFTFCDSISNINLNLQFCDLCDVTPLSEIDGRIWGKITDENGLGISGAKVTLPKWNWSVPTDKNGNYIFFDVLFGNAGSIEIDAEGYELYQSNSIFVSEEVPSVEVNFELTPKTDVASNTISGFVWDEQGNPVKGAYVEFSAEYFNGEVVCNNDGSYSFQIPGNTPQSIFIAPYAPNYQSTGATADYDGSTDIEQNFNLDPSWTLTVEVQGVGGQKINSTVSLQTRFEFAPDQYIWSPPFATADINNGLTSCEFYGLNSSYNPIRIVVDATTPGWQDTEIQVNLNGSTTESFILPKEQVTLDLSVPNGGGEVSGDGTFDYGDNVNITATPEDGYRFVNWTRVSDGSEFNTVASTSFVIEENIALNANFEVIPN